MALMIPMTAHCAYVMVYPPCVAASIVVTPIVFIAGLPDMRAIPPMLANIGMEIIRPFAKVLFCLSSFMPSTTPRAIELMSIIVARLEQNAEINAVALPMATRR